MPANNDAIVTVTEIQISHQIRKKVITITADSGDGSVPNTAMGLRGWVFMVVTNPGSPAPTDDYDIVLNDSNGFDIMGGTLANRDQTNTEQAFPLLVGTTYGQRYVDGSLTMALSNNIVNSAQIVINIYYERDN